MSGIGPIGALSVAFTIDPGRFTSGRHFAAWPGLVPKEHSTGGRQRLGEAAEGSACVRTWNGCGGGISRVGNERLRQLLVLGATAMIQYAKPGSKSASAWLLALLERKPRKLALVALANKVARIAWAKLAKVPTDQLRSVRRPAEGIMATGEMYRGSRKGAKPAAGIALAA